LKILDNKLKSQDLIKIIIDEQRVQHDQFVEQLGEFKTGKEMLISQIDQKRLNKMKSIDNFGEGNPYNVLKINQNQPT
jgi:hypothetical protein